MSVRLSRKVLTPGLILHLDSLRVFLRYKPRLWRVTLKEASFLTHLVLICSGYESR